MNVHHDKASSTRADTAFERLRSRVLAYLPEAEVPLKRAYEVSLEAHAGQTRKSGEPFVMHAVEVAQVLADLSLDATTLVAALLHDVVEDSDKTIAGLKSEFGDQVANLVDGVTKIGELSFASEQTQQAENFRKMLLSMARDIRVIFIKLADRLHNMRTLQFLSPEKTRRIARETLEIYAPLAHRLGMGAIRCDLEDLAFKFLEPKVYHEVAAAVESHRGERERYIDEVRESIHGRLLDEGIEAEITGRAKHLYSIHRKMQKRKVPVDEIHDLVAIRVITDSVGECYHALGIIHTQYTPVHERIKDYIASPKSNLYRSLHTTVLGPRGRMVEIQIRTREMHQTCEAGIAAHWRYKEEGEADARWDDLTKWIREVLDWQGEYTDPHEFMEMLKIDLFQQEVYVFTPKGELIQLPQGATALDFAFAIHTEVGYRCVGAKVDGRLVPLRIPLESGHKVEIVTNPSGHPSNDWLQIARTSRARSKIRRWIRREEEVQSVAFGKEVLEKECRKNKLRIPREKELPDLANSHGFETVEKFFAAIGRGDVSVRSVVRKLAPSAPERKPKANLLSTETYLSFIRRSTKGIRVEGQENMMIRFAQCCNPVPGDPIVGIVTRGRGVSVHRVDCFNTFEPAISSDRLIDVSWDVEKGREFLVRIEVIADDRKGLVTDITRKIAETGTNIRAGDFNTQDAQLQLHFVLEVRNLGHLKKIVKSIERMPEVVSVGRRAQKA